MKITIDNVTIEGTEEECERFFLKNLKSNKSVKNNDEKKVEDQVQKWLEKNPQSIIKKDIKTDSISAAVIAQHGCSCSLSGSWYHRSDCEAGLG